MKEIIRNLFSENNYSRLSIKDTGKFDLEFWEYDKNEAYYVILYLKVNQLPSNFLTNEIPQLFNNLKKNLANYLISMDKNMTLIICLEEVMGGNEKIDQFILDIEEDPYFFKKNVIRYNDNDLTIFNTQSKTNITKFINETVNDIKRFEEFKEYGDSYYEFCANLLIKFPFLVFRNKREDLNNLSENIEEEIKTKNLNALFKSIQSEYYDEKNMEEVITKIKELYDEEQI